MDKPEQDPPKPRSFRQRCFRVVKLGVRGFLLFVAFYILLVLIGLIPVNNDFEPTPDGIEVQLISSSVHADIILPSHNHIMDWRKYFPPSSFSADINSATHVSLGWGDRGFYINTPTWADLRVSTAANALFWPSGSCMHVWFLSTHEIPEDARSVKISSEQYQRLVDYIDGTFQKDENGSVMRIENTGQGYVDEFFHARGSYHCFNTCNCWAGDALHSAGIQVGWFTPMPKTPFLYLPD